MLDLTGQKFNRLTAIRPVGRDKNRVVIWEFQCECGKIVNVRGCKVKRGSTKSCGCFKAENLKHEGQDHPQWDGYQEISKSFYSRMMTTAKQRGWNWELTIEYLWDLFVNQDRKCAITGIELVMPIHLRQLTKRNQIVASLDRIDSDKPYVEGNVRWVCKRVNYMKHTQGDDIFFQFVKSIYEYNKLNLLKKDVLILTNYKNQTLYENSRKRKYNTKKVLKYDLDGNFIQEYSSCKEAAVKNNRSVNVIYACCQNKKRDCKKYIWKYAENS